MSTTTPNGNGARVAPLPLAPASDTPPPSPAKGLYAKLAQVTAELGYVRKDGRNDFQNYAFMSAEALLAAVRGPLAARNIVLMPALTALSEREYSTSKGKASVITTAHVTFTLVDGDSGERHECAWAGQGDDPGDKGLGKAYTNAIKTFLRGQLLIPQGDDPEADAGADRRSQDRAGRELAREIVSNRPDDPFDRF
ncbi:MAG: ERF family protein, partial [Solirubrobacteraceae bacterium]